jgi:PAS domain S-box-containing protein
MSLDFDIHTDESQEAPDRLTADLPLPDLAEAESVLLQLAEVFFQNGSVPSAKAYPSEVKGPNIEERYRALVEQIPAIVFMAYLDRGIGEAYVSPQIEEKLGFTQREWLEDPVRWYQQIHPKDKDRWSVEAATVFITGKPLQSSYRVLARDGRVVWFHCEAKLIRRDDGRPWFIHGVAFDITELKRTEEALQEERNVVSAILDTVGALVVVVDCEGRIVRFNRACEQTCDYSLDEVKGKYIWDLFIVPEDLDRFRTIFEQLRTGQPADDYETTWLTRDGTRRLIAWSSTVLPGDDGSPSFIIATGIDITEKKRLEKSILEVSGREQRRIGQDLHDGLGQHLTGIAFLAKVQEQNLAAKGLPEATAAAKIVKLVNEAIYKTRELSRGLHPVLSEPNGLMMALQQLAGEVEDVFHVSCAFQSEGDVFIHDENVATHLFRIGQEAVNNAVKHAKPENIRIVLARTHSSGYLTVTDNGHGFPVNLKGRTGMGLHIMNYRASMIGGSLELQRRTGGGCRVVCTFPLRLCGDQGGM